MDYVVGPVQLSDIQEASEYMKGKLQPSPLVQLWEHKDIFLKLENLQPCGSFKLRGALNAIRKIPIETLELGICTASTGNFAKCLAWIANTMDIRCNVLVPSHIPMNQLSAIEELDGNITKVELDEWWEAIETHIYEGMQGKLIHAVCEPDVIAGVGTIGLEIVDCIPDISNIIVPYGGGGLICGIAIAAKSHNPNIKVYACEVETACPLKAALQGEEPVTFSYQTSFVDGIGVKSILPEIWPLVKSLVTDSIVVSLQEVADTVKLLSEGNHVRAEGAGAATVAAAMKGVVGVGKTACIISGGNIDTDKYIQCLQGTVPI
ncbi:L-threonine ammonia-lyase-like [Mytilus californianus]|uniref:L-threonine ammonia-lyase-like n=1 Tax=Mytilus californianus TaxID=6549 RepID=UPI002246EB53|nr:L-threonine ammonia-lyase-like [Mytilus californianus]